MSELAVSEDENKVTLANVDRYLTLFLEEEQYGLDIKFVKEIIAMMKTTSVPKTPNFLEGVMNLRGNIIPVVNLRRKFAMETKETDDRTAIVIVTIQGTDIGFIVDGVDEVISVDKSQYSEPPQFGTKIDTEFVSKMVRVESGVIMVLDLNKVFNEKELSFFDSIDEEEETLV